MATTPYCWRCEMDLPMLDEDEWQRVGGLLVNTVHAIKSYRELHGVSLREAQDAVHAQALALYRELTGFEETNCHALWHHRISIYGPPCRQCGKPLRTPVAKRCFACGTDRQR